MKKIVIIGGGIAGLSAGIFAQKNGFESIILEKHHTLGGECTGWNRQGYHIDGCIHWLVGTKEGTPMHTLWTQVGALEGTEVFHPETFLSFEYEGNAVHLCRDLERLRSSWLRLAPQDKEAVEDFYQTVKALQAFNMPVDKPISMMTLFEKIKLISSMKEAGAIMDKYGKISLKTYARRFKHPVLRELLANFLPEGYSASSIFFALASFTKGDASIPYGGSKAMAMRMEDKYRSLGGTVIASSEVVKLNIKDKQVDCLVTKDGKKYQADYYIAACDAHRLYEHLLEGRYSDSAFKKRFSNSIDYPLASNIYIALAYEGELDNLPRSLRFQVTPFKIHHEEIHYLTINHYQYEKTFAPEGHSVITCAINQFYSDYEAWDQLSQDMQAYQQEKVRIGSEVLRAVEMRFPYMKGKVKVLDVATPKTYERYCNAYRGAFMGFLPTIKGKMMAHSGHIKGVKNLFLSGQWLQPPGGLPVAVITGRDTIMWLCKKEKKPFTYY